MKKILLLGAAGRIGSLLRTHLPSCLNNTALVAADIVPLIPLNSSEETVQLDILDIDSLESAMEGVECVIHLAGIPEERTFNTLLEPNIQGTYNVFEAAHRTKVQRVIYASSIHAIGFHPLNSDHNTNTVLRPSSYYGLTKAFGELVGSLYADKYGLSVICLRIGSFVPHPTNAHHLSIWLSYDDTIELFRSAIEAPDIKFAVAYGISANERSPISKSESSLIHFLPTDNAETYASTIPEEPIPFLGGEFCNFDPTPKP